MFLTIVITSLASFHFGSSATLSVSQTSLTTLPQSRSNASDDLRHLFRRMQAPRTSSVSTGETLGIDGSGSGRSNSAASSSIGSIDSIAPAPIPPQTRRRVRTGIGPLDFSPNFFKPYHELDQDPKDKLHSHLGNQIIKVKAKKSR